MTVRPRLLLALVGVVSGCATKQADQFGLTVQASGQYVCIKHRVSLISVRGFDAGATLVHSADPRHVSCRDQSPNIIYPSQDLGRSALHTRPTTITYCPRCWAAYCGCMSGHWITQADINQISAAMTHRSNLVGKPTLRIVSLGSNQAYAEVGRQEKAGDVFYSVGATRQHGQWRLEEGPIAHKVEAVGRYPFPALLRNSDRH